MDCILDLIESILKFVFGNHEGQLDRTGVWTAFAALAAFLAVLVARSELGSTRKTTQADFAKRFVDSYFTSETRAIFALLMNSALQFEVLSIKDKDGAEIDNLPFFKIKTAIADQLKGIVDIDSAKIGYSAFEIDDLLLGPLDDIGWYKKHKLINMETIREMFGYYIYECYKNEELQKYIQHECNKDKFENFKCLAKFIINNPQD